MRAGHVVARVMLLVVAAGCADLTINPAYNNIPTSFTDPSFSRDIMPIIRQTCASSDACHAGPNAPQGLRMDSDSAAYANLVNVPATFTLMLRVRPSMPDSSFMWRVLSVDPVERLGYYRMPLTELALPQATIDMIGNWITQGALDN